MRRYFQTVRASFSATREQNDRREAHYYAIEVTFEDDAPKYPFGAVVADATVEQTRRIIGELRGRHLNDMMGPANPSMHGLAAYLLERLTILGATRVEVHEDTDDACAIERVPS